MELEFHLEVFDGPLDLLLHLIARHKLNIYDIEISKLLDQYLLYMARAKEQNLELAGEFVEMAARLVYLKTVSLLPKPEVAAREKEALQGTLIEYSLCQRIARGLRDRFVGLKVFVRKPMPLPPARRTYALTHSPELLQRALRQMGKVRPDEHRLSRHIGEAVTPKRYVPVQAGITRVMTRLLQGKSATLSSLYEGVSDRSERIAVFLAVLDLVHDGRVRLSDDNTTLTLCTGRESS